MDLAIPTLAALMAGLPGSLSVNVCDSAPCRQVEIRADGNKVIIVGDATAEQVLSVVLRSMLAQQKAEQDRFDRLAKAMAATNPAAPTSPGPAAPKTAAPALSTCPGA